MPVTESEIRQILLAELASIAVPPRRALLESYLVPPTPLVLKWGYGKPGERFDCWQVGLSPDGSERLIYCEKGFGPANPWGFVRAAEDWIGMDSQWHAGLEHAAIGIGLLPAPPDYEVP